MGSRLENFFWRIWGNQAIRDRIRGSQVAALFSSISEGGFIRTTPTQSPRNSRSIGNFRAPIPDGSPPTSPQFTLGPSTSRLSSAGKTEIGSRQSFATIQGPSPTLSTPVTASQENKSRVTLPPILKKPSAGSAIKLNKSARVLSPPEEIRRATSSSSQLVDPTSTSLSNRGPGTIRFDSKTKSPATESSLSTAQSTEKVTTQPEQPAQKSSRKKATFLVGAGPSKKRPVAVRQRSSQSSSSAASSVTSPPPPTVNIAEQRGIPQVGSGSRASSQPTRSSSTKNPRSSSPHPPKQGQATSRDDSPSGESSEASSGEAGREASDGGNREENKSPLVDPDFRSRFVDRTQPGQRSLATLSSLAPKCAAVAAPASYQAAGMLGFGLPSEQASRARNRVELPEEAALAVADEDQGLTRTKSQLTLLLEKDRRPGDEGKRPNEGGRRRSRSPP